MDPRLGSTNPNSPSGIGRRRRVRTVLGIALLSLILASGIHLDRGSLGDVHAAPDAPTPPAETMPADLFRGWDRPELVLVVSGQSFGYLQPCGCSSPQYGGLTRRYNFIQLLKKKGWDVAAFDLGDLYPKKTELRDQAKEKYKTTLQALDAMNYRFFGLGELELKMPLVQGLAEATNLNLKSVQPLVLNLQDPNGVYKSLGVTQYEVMGTKVKVGVTSMVGASLAKENQDPNQAFFPNPDLLRQVLEQFAKRQAEVTLLIYHGSTQRPPGGAPPVDDEVVKCAEFCAQLKAKNPQLPNVDIIFHVSDFDTPPNRPQPVPMVPGTRTQIMGHNGKYVGALGLFKKAGGGYELKYELISLGPEFETPASARANHPVEKLLEDYATTVKQRDFLNAFAPLRDQHLTQRTLAQKEVEVRYVGSEMCGSCHDHAYEIWQKTRHSHAFQTLADVKNPPHRQFDPECVVCHVVGFKHKTGYFDPPQGASAKKVAEHNAKLLDVGCESCHGPGSMHANNPDDRAYYPLINPIKLSNPNAELKLDFFCQTCHDIDNDVHWGTKQFKKSWAQIAHTTPRKK